MKRRLRFQLLLLTGALGASLQAQVPSQRQLNGFLIGQHEDAIAASFDTVLQIDTTSDGWVYRTYLLDRAHSAYMSFKFPSAKPDYAVSVQIAGDSGTGMIPFVGIVLGAPRSQLVSRFGGPSQVERQTDVGSDLLLYDQRNYSFEIDSHGRVSSIQILAAQGFSQLPAETAPSLDSLAWALAAGPDAMLEYVAPDLEVYRGGEALSFRRGALTELRDSTSDIARVLFDGPTSLSAILQSRETRSSGDINMRVWERGGSGWVWKPPTSVPIAEVVFKADAGRWRLWEVAYR